MTADGGLARPLPSDGTDWLVDILVDGSGHDVGVPFALAPGSQATSAQIGYAINDAGTLTCEGALVTSSDGSWRAETLAVYGAPHRRSGLFGRGARVAAHIDPGPDHDREVVKHSRGMSTAGHRLDDGHTHDLIRRTRRRPYRAVRTCERSRVMSEPRGRVRAEPSHKRVRVFVGGECIVDTADAMYVWEGPNFPQYYLAKADFAAGTLVPSTTTAHSPSRGTASYFTVHAAGRDLVDAAWTYDDSPLDELRGCVRLDWNAMDAWFEEDEEVFVHPRDPATHVQILPSSRHVTVAIDGVVVADSRRPTFLYETGLPRRTYLPKLDVRMDLLVPTDTTSMCPYKGTAEYWSVRTPEQLHADRAWSYRTPLPESTRIAGLVAFYDEVVDLTVDGTRQPRPRTHFVKDTS